MKKRVLIIMPSMFIGGAERSLLGLLDAFDYDKFEVSLFLYRHEGEFIPFINKHVKIIPSIPEYETFDVSIKSLLVSGKVKHGLLRLKAKLDQKDHAKKYPNEDGIWMHMQKISKNLQRSLPNIPGEYDLGIMFLGVPDTLVNKVNAKVKMAWNHTDYTTLHADKEYDHSIYSKTNYIVSVSEQSRKQFVNVYPEFENKAIVIENILSESFILKQADESISDMKRRNDEIILLSVGRFSYAKNFDNVPDITKRIIQQGVSITWYLIGYGGDESLIRDKIKESHMEEHVIILGKKINPYPYIKQCDVYVQPSRFEGKSVTVREAQLLGKPVIITNYASAKSQLEDDVDGIVVPLDNEGCAKGITNILIHPEITRLISDNCQSRDYTNKEAFEIIDMIAGSL